MTQPTRIIHATAPIRICDLGGWTDTWFAGQGAVLNMGVYPYAEVEITVRETPPGKERSIVIHAANFGDRYVIEGWPKEYDKHPLLEACIDIMELPRGLSFEVNLFSHAPAGCSTGTSASVSVALLAALDMLTPGRLAPYEIARLAHRVETEKLGLQCGIQDQLAAAYGGVSFIEMYQYPHASVSRLLLPESMWWELDRRMVLVFLGKSHTSSDVHGRVIQRLEAENADKSDLDVLRRAAMDGKNALAEGKLDLLGKAMIENTEGQRRLHPSLVSEGAQQIIDLAKAHGAIGWKVNGAGGDGGSLSILCGGSNQSKRDFIAALPGLDPAFRYIPTNLSPMGVRRWELPG